MDTSKLLLYGGGALAVYYFFIAPKSGGALPGSGLFPAPASQGQSPTTYGVNSGQKGGSGSFYTVANYQQLLQANPNLGNPNYQLTQAERNQYIANYSDLQTGIATWPGGITPANVQRHWNVYGVPEQRIFLPLQPPSTAAWIAPPSNPASSGGSSTFSSILGVATTVLGLILGPSKDEKLNDKDLELLFTGAYVIYEILPLYAESDPALTMAIKDKLTDVLTQYS